MPSITSKQQMYGLLRGGALGHTLPSASKLEDLHTLKDKAERFALRTLKAGGACYYDLSFDEMLAKALALGEGGYDATCMLDDSKRVCYCHLLDSEYGWRLHYTTDKKPARLKGDEQEKHLEGLSARLYLQSVMDQRGWDTLNELILEYPDHVYEFSVMQSKRHAMGDSNVIFWEVRAATGEYERGHWKQEGPKWAILHRELDGD
jgi:hypothetical protein